MARVAFAPPQSGERDDKGPKATHRPFYVGEDRYNKTVNGREYWYYRYRTERNGNKIVLQDRTLEGLREKERPIFEAIAKGADIATAKKTTFQSCFDSYISKKAKDKEIAPGTITVYKTAWKTIEPVFGATPVADIKKDEIVNFFHGLSDSFSKDIISKIKVVMSGAFEEAILKDLITESPLDNAKVKIQTKNVGLKPRERKGLTLSEQKAFLEAVSTVPWLYHICIILLHTGLRIGELMGLTAKDVDLPSCTVVINHQLQIDAETRQLYVCPPKSRAGYRTVYFDEECRESFEYFLNNGHKSPTLGGMTDFILVGEDGKIISETKIYCKTRSVTKAYNAIHPTSEPLRTVSPHLLRHTYGIRAAESGVNPKVLQILMGHEKLEVTMNLYVDGLDESAIRSEAGKIKFDGEG